MTTLSRLLRPSLLALSLACAPGLALAQEPSAVPSQDPAKDASKDTAKPAPDTVVAKINGTPVTQGDLDLASDDPALNLPGVEEGAKQGMLVDYLIDLKLGSQAAEKAGIGSGDAFKRKLAYLRDKLLVDEYLDGESKKAVTPEAAKQLYDQTVKAMKPEEEVHARHILVDNEADAKKIEARIKAGEDFAKVAADTSKDKGSKEDGGDLGWFTKERMVAPFAEAAFKMSPGQISDPVKTQFGWHVIKLEEKRVKPIPGFEEMKDQIDQYLTRKAQQDIMVKLREQAKVERTDAAKTAPLPPTTDAPTAEPKK